MELNSYHLETPQPSGTQISTIILPLSVNNVMHSFGIQIYVFTIEPGYMVGYAL